MDYDVNPRCVTMKSVKRGAATWISLYASAAPLFVQEEGFARVNRASTWQRLIRLPAHDGQLLVNNFVSCSSCTAERYFPGGKLQEIEETATEEIGDNFSEKFRAAK